MCLSNNLMSPVSGQQQRTGRGLSILATGIAAGQGNAAAQDRMAAFRSHFQSMHPQRAAALAAQTTGGPVSVTGG